MTELTRRVIDFQLSSDRSRQRMLDYRSIVSSCMEIVYHNCSIGGVNGDSAAEFLLYMTPKLGRIIRGFRYNGLDFEFFLLKTIRIRADSFLANRWEKVKRSKAFEIHSRLEYEQRFQEFNDGYGVMDEEPEFGYQPPENPLYFALCRIGVVCHYKLVWKKRMITYFLSVLSFMTSAQRTFICDFFKLNEREVERYYQFFFENHQEKIEKPDKLSKSLSCHYFQSLFIETTLAKTSQTVTEEKQASLDFLKETKDRIEKRIGKIRNIRHEISQSVLGQLLSLSRGTVASHLFYAKMLIVCAIDPKCPKITKFTRDVQAMLAESYDIKEARNLFDPVSLDEILHRLQLESTIPGPKSER